MTDQPPVFAAGAVVVRDGLVLVVHRPKYDDWTLPKGKAEADEALVHTAVREVGEETGVTVRLGPPLTPLRYFVAEGLKLVHWWQGVALAEGPRTAPADEIDQAEWLAAGAAQARLTYADERDLLAEALALAPTTPLVLVRHAKAVKRKHWKGADRDRPLDDRGKAQLPYLDQVLAAYGVTQWVTSPAARCVATVDRGATPPTPDERLTEEAGAADPAGLAAAVAEWAEVTATSGRPTALCLHRPNLPAMLAALGVPERPLAPAGVIAVHLDPAARPVALDWHDPVRVKL